MAVTPTGAMGVPVKRMGELIAASATFQALVGAEDATEAAESIYYVGIKGKPQRPCALVALADAPNFRRESSSDTVWRDEAAVSVVIEAVVSPDNVDSYGDAEFAFTNAVSGILDDVWMAGYGTGGSNLLLRSFEQVSGPARSGKAEKSGDQDYYQVCWRFGIGIGL